MEKIKVRLKKNGFETEYNENIARILIRRGEAELAEREVPRRGPKPVEAKEESGRRGRRPKAESAETDEE
jgi:hypothetical protein